jgi:NAD(P)-dependent dehydrogenase (short-subunit alcohol dehydrogenase family)
VQEIMDGGGEAVACYASVADEHGAKSIVTTALDAFGRLDVIINNAGIHDPGLFETLSVEQYRAMLDVHFFGSVLVARAAWPHFVKTGYGRIVNTVSEAMFGGIPELTSYGSAKGAVFGLTRNLATEGANHGIRVNAIAPRAYTRMSGSHSDALSEVFGMSKEMIDEINASIQKAQAALKLADIEVERQSTLVERQTGTQQRLDVVTAQQGDGRGELARQKASLEKAQLQLSYTEIRAPLAGRIGRATVSVGNFVGPSTGPLATIVSIGHRPSLRRWHDRQVELLSHPNGSF